MNKLFFLFAFIIFKFTYNMNAQNKDVRTDSEINDEYRKTRDAMNNTGKFKSTFKMQSADAAKSAVANLKEGLSMRDGKMVSIKDDTFSPMNYNITLTNGTHVTMQGVCELKNGKKIIMDDGDFMDYNGVYVPLKQL